MQTLRRNWWLLAICGLLTAALAAACSFMQAPDGSLVWRHAAVRGTTDILGRWALAAGLCTVAAGVWRLGRSLCWPLMINGLALGALGVMLLGMFGAGVLFRTIAGLMVVMALGLAALMLSAVRGLRRSAVSLWLLGLAFAGSLVYALAFAVMKPVPETHSELLWVGSYFGFQAVCFLGLAWRLRAIGVSRDGRWAMGPLGGNASWITLRH
ncbi:hypothetical protein [Paludibaculum fermentans]|uniref:DUF998 domain-containing protein n=1 Tax=Paludibaculum fermentans TaxID=1473598 RepID=A0A7S7NV40_PALFE|nr:hypothetical protein [Paludibaculum fermentans]QOY90361.1 hypothetical protein IRI77_10515 [Paludibaculum fermentans]